MDFKGIIRVTHLLSTTALCGGIVLNYFSEDKMNQKIKRHENYNAF